MSPERAVRRLLDDSRATVGIVADFPDPAAGRRGDRGRRPRELRACIVAAGRPFRKDARGFFAIAIGPSHTAVGVAAAHMRMAALDSTQTVWLIFADDRLQAEIRDVLARQAATNGAA